MPHAKTIAQYLLNIGAVKLSLNPPFTWTSGLKSPIYCDNRMIYSYPEARNFVVDALVARVKALHIEPDVIAGTATAGIGWGALVADRLNLPFVYVRSKAKEHGAQKRIEGDLLPEKQVAVVEDLLSTGGSAIATVEALREEGKCMVADVVAIFSYQLSAVAEKAQQSSVTFHPLSDFSTLLNVALEMGSITEEELSSIAEFIKDPEGWGSKVV